MKKLLVLLMIVSLPAYAIPPCAGKKGGVAYCAKETFVCNNGTVSASHYKCDPKVYGTKQHPKKSSHKVDHPNEKKK